MIQHARRALPAITSSRRSAMPAGRGSRGLPRAQQGVALVVALILLVVITLIGLAAVSGTIMQNKMASNQYDRQVAFQSAESTLRQARTWLSTNAGDTTIRDCTTDSNPCLTDPFTGGNRVADAIHTPEAVGNLATASPQYIVEKVAAGGGGTGKGCSSANSKQRNADINGTCLTPIEAANFYRITARSGAPDQVGDRAIVTLQSVIRLRVM